MCLRHYRCVFKTLSTKEATVSTEQEEALSKTAPADYPKQDGTCRLSEARRHLLTILSKTAPADYPVGQQPSVSGAR